MERRRLEGGEEQEEEEDGEEEALQRCCFINIPDKRWEFLLFEVKAAAEMTGGSGSSERDGLHRSGTCCRTSEDVHV